MNRIIKPPIIMRDDVAQTTNFFSTQNRAIAGEYFQGDSLLLHR